MKLRETLGDPTWTPTRWWGRMLSSCVYLAVAGAFGYAIRDEPYPLLWASVGLLVAVALYWLWWRWAMRRPSERENAR